MAQIASTYHMIHVLSSYGPVYVIGFIGLSLGLAEYVISQEYAIMRDNNKLKNLMLASLITLSCISALANIESFARFYDWSVVSGYQVYYVWFAGSVYSVIVPAVIVVTSFIRLQDDRRPEVVKKSEIIPPELTVVKPNAAAAKKKVKKLTDSSGLLAPGVLAHLQAL